MLARFQFSLDQGHRGNLQHARLLTAQKHIFMLLYRHQVKIFMDLYMSLGCMAITGESAAGCPPTIESYKDWQASFVTIDQLIKILLIIKQHHPLNILRVLKDTVSAWFHDGIILLDPASQFAKTIMPTCK